MTSRRRKINEGSLAGALTLGGIGALPALIHFMNTPVRKDETPEEKTERLKDFAIDLTVMLVAGTSLGAASGGVAAHVATRSRKIADSGSKKSKKNLR